MLDRFFLFFHNGPVAKKVRVKERGEVVTKDADVSVAESGLPEFSRGYKSINRREAYAGDRGAIGAAQDRGDPGQAIIGDTTRGSDFGYNLGIQVVYVETE